MLNEGKWNGDHTYNETSRSLEKKILGIVGMGRVGREVAIRAKGLGMRIIYHNRNRLAPELEMEAEYRGSIYDLLGESDCVMLCLPATSNQKPIINKQTLQLMKQSATLVNIARGIMVDEEALADALEDGTITAAGLDVHLGEEGSSIRDKQGGGYINPRLLNNWRCTNLPVSIYIYISLYI